MKKSMYSIFAVIIALVMSASYDAIAQKPFSEGKIVYEISYPDMEMDNSMAAMMPTEQLVYVKGHMSRSDFSMGMGMSSSSITNAKTGEVIALTDMMGSKSAVRISGDDIKKAGETSKNGKPKVTLTNETREIAGFNCKKAVLTMESGTTLDIYYTDKITAKLSGSTDFKEINGFPLEYAIEQSGIKMKFTAKSVSAEKVADNLFAIPSDYKVMTQEEMRKQFGGGQ
jgi:GLPGLI family protein